MVRLNSFLFATVVAVGVLAGGVVRADNPPPTRLAVVNIVKVFTSLDAKTAGDKELEDMAKSLNTEKTAKEKDVEEARGTLEQLKADSPAYLAARDVLLQKTMDLQAFSGYIDAKLAMEQRLKTMGIYKAINDAIAQMSKERGIALVLVTDDVNLGDARSQAELLSRISIRKVIYADDSLDITKDVILRMNQPH